MTFSDFFGGIKKRLDDGEDVTPEEFYRGLHDKIREIGIDHGLIVEVGILVGTLRKNVEKKKEALNHFKKVLKMEFSEQNVRETVSDVGTGLKELANIKAEIESEIKEVVRGGKKAERLIWKGIIEGRLGDLRISLLRIHKSFDHNKEYFEKFSEGFRRYIAPQLTALNRAIENSEQNVRSFVRMAEDLRKLLQGEITALRQKFEEYAVLAKKSDQGGADLRRIMIEFRAFATGLVGTLEADFRTQDVKINNLETAANKFIGMLDTLYELLVVGKEHFGEAIKRTAGLLFYPVNDMHEPWSIPKNREGFFAAIKSLNNNASFVKTCVPVRRKTEEEKKEFYLKLVKVILRTKPCLQSVLNSITERENFYVGLENSYIEDKMDLRWHYARLLGKDTPQIDDLDTLSTFEGILVLTFLKYPANVKFFQRPGNILTRSEDIVADGRRISTNYYVLALNYNFRPGDASRDTAGVHNGSVII